jgi:hypothetical protein
MRVIVLKGKVQQHLKITESVCCSDDANFELMVITHAEETNHSSAAWKFCDVKQNLYQRKQNRAFTKGSKCNPKSILWTQAGIFHCC